MWCGAGRVPSVQRPKGGAASVAREFGDRVRRQREALTIDDRPVSQERLAERAGLHRTYVGHVERGEVNPALWNVVRLAAALDVDPSVLVTGLRPEPPA